jgi:hypothetical protein
LSVTFTFACSFVILFISAHKKQWIYLWLKIK